MAIIKIGNFIIPAKFYVEIWLFWKEFPVIDFKSADFIK